MIRAQPSSTLFPYTTLFRSRGEKRYAEFGDVPAVTEIVKDESRLRPLRTMIDIMSVSRGFFGPANMDPQAVSELRAGIAKTLADADFVAEAAKRGLPMSFYSGESEQARIQRAMEGGKDLAPILK